MGNRRVTKWEWDRTFLEFAKVPLWITQWSWSGWLSSSSFTFRTQRVKLIDLHSKITDRDGLDVSVGEACVEWLKENDYTRHAMRRSDYDNSVFYPPLYVRPGASQSDEWGYFDLKAAYPSIYTRLRWDDEYIPQRWARRGVRPLSGFPYLHNKLARNALIGIARGGASHYYHLGRLESSKKYGSLANYHLIGAIMAVLHHIAYVAVNHFSFEYWNTDGGLCSYEKGMMFAEWVKGFWGLDLRPKHKGKATITGVGNYSIGEYETKIKSNRARWLDNISIIDNSDIDRLLFLLS